MEILSFVILSLVHIVLFPILFQTKRSTNTEIPKYLITSKYVKKYFLTKI